MRKIIFLGAGSEKDPGFEGLYDKKRFADRGITVIDPMVIESCHGCPELMTHYSKQMQSLVDDGDKVVGVLQGGLMFALPSIQATQVTYPIISCPLDLISYTSFMVPSGHAAISTVGIEMINDKLNNTTQRKRALFLAEDILNLEAKAVQIECPDKTHLDKLITELSKFGIKTTKGSQLVLTYNECLYHLKEGIIQLWADSNEDLMNGGYLNLADKVISNQGGFKGTLQVRGMQNLAIYAAKILSLNNPELREQIKGLKVSKRKTYQRRYLLNELGGK